MFKKYCFFKNIKYWKKCIRKKLWILYVLINKKYFIFNLTLFRLCNFNIFFYYVFYYVCNYAFIHLFL